MFISSEFLRARQTAEECRAALTNILSFERQADAAAGGGGGGEEDVPDEGKESPEEGGGELSLDGGADVGGYDVSPPIVIRRLLNERSFGELDGTILVNYNKVPGLPEAQEVLGVPRFVATTAVLVLTGGTSDVGRGPPGNCARSLTRGHVAHPAN